MSKTATLISYQFFRCTNHRHFIASINDKALQIFEYGSVGNMPTIPREKEIHIVDTGHSDMNGITRCSFWKQPRSHNPLGQFINI